jgi:uncharacterized protein (DUF305 family)
MKVEWWMRLGAVMAVAQLGGCAAAGGVAEVGPSVVQPGAPGEASRPVVAADAAAAARRPHTEADVAFMREMIVHHAQALEMTSLVPERSQREEIRLLARRIALSQDDEMALMRHWLTVRGEAYPEVRLHGDGHRHGGVAAEHGLMPGMITPAEMAQLEAARGDEFDRLFLGFMIRHHEGALAMVEALFASPGSGQEAEISQFAAHVDADQRIEIDRMSAMLYGSR